MSATGPPDRANSPVVAAFQAEHGWHGAPEPSGQRERRCPTCEARVTIGTDGETEYGHKYRCPERPDDFPGGGSGSGYHDPAEGSA